VNKQILAAVRAAEKAVGRAVEACRKGGPLYAQSPRAVAQASRTGKGFLNALAALQRDLNAPAASEGPPEG
jgi:hypothetical protein